MPTEILPVIFKIVDSKWSGPNMYSLLFSKGMVYGNDGEKSQILTLWCCPVS